MIRDVGLALAMGDTPSVSWLPIWQGRFDHERRSRPAGGRDLHIGAWHVGVPSNRTAAHRGLHHDGAGLCRRPSRSGPLPRGLHRRGASSSGEFWEAMNPQVRAAYRSPTFFKTTKLPSTRHPRTNLASNSGGQGCGNGLPGLDDRRFRPGGHHASVAVAREFGLEGGGPTLIHVENAGLGTPTTTTTCTLSPIRSDARLRRRGVVGLLGSQRPCPDAPCAAA